MACAFPMLAGAEQKWLEFKGKDGPGKGKHIVLVSGDEEYRSEESMPMLAKILSNHHGFDTTVLFAWSKDGAYIDPNNGSGIIGWEKLDTADLMIIGTRFRAFTPATIKHLGAYLEAGKPVVGFRTATHAFNGKGKMGNIGAGEWGLKVLGERWSSPRCTQAPGSAWHDRKGAGNASNPTIGQRCFRAQRRLWSKKPD